MTPEKLFRTQKGLVFVTYEETHNESIREAAHDLLLLLEGRNVYFGNVILNNRDNVISAMETLNNALDGKLVTTYTL